MEKKAKILMMPKFFEHQPYLLCNLKFPYFDELLTRYSIQDGKYCQILHNLLIFTVMVMVLQDSDLSEECPKNIAYNLKAWFGATIHRTSFDDRY